MKCGVAAILSQAAIRPESGGNELGGGSFVEVSKEKPQLEVRALTSYRVWSAIIL